MSDLFLGLIALAVLVMAASQVAAIVFALRTARRVGEAVNRLEQDVRPIVANLHTMSADAARATSLAAAQVERVERLVGDVSRRVDDTAAAVQSSILRPAREGIAMVQGVIAALAALRQSGAPRKHASPADEEDPLFIG